MHPEQLMYGDVSVMYVYCAFNLYVIGVHDRLAVNVRVR